MASSQQPNHVPLPAAVSTGSVMVKPVGDNLDMAWEWNSLKDINNKKSVTCDFCGKTSNGGITRAKRHQIGVRGDVGACKKIPHDIKLKIKAAYEQKKANNDAAFGMEKELDDEAEALDEIYNIKTGKRLANSTIAPAAKRDAIKGPMDLLMMRSAEASNKITVAMAKRQKSIQDSCVKEARNRTNQYIARFFYRNGIPFNVARCKSFKHMIDAVGSYGKHLNPPSYHELRVPLLKKELELTKEMLKPHELERSQYGCSIMSDAWTDRKNRTLINLLVNSPSGTMFVRSLDASGYMKTGLKLFELLDSFVEEIGEQKVVQVVTDNGSNYVLAGKYLEDKRKKLFWTPCAAHCVDLMLEDIGKISRIKKAIGRGQFLVGFIYNHTLALNMMRKFTSMMELVRSGVTRFATTFLTLQRLYKQKNNLRRMFTSEEWLTTNIAKERKGKRATEIVLMTIFWSDVIYALKAMGPLVKVLRLVDNERKPAMGYIYESMDRAKEAIEKSFNHVQDKYRDIFEIIDRRWECQLHHPLHAAGHFLNPQHFYNDPNVDKDPEVSSGLYICIDRLCLSAEDIDKALSQVAIYRRAEGMFGIASAIRQRSTMAPAEWWMMYGKHVPTLQAIAIRVLSLTCSSSGCERNWSTFEQIHSKKRSKLEHQKLQDLVFVKYNQTLKDRHDSKDLIDPIVLDNIDDSNDWLVGEIGEDGEVPAEDELVFEDDNLTWGVVNEASGAGEPTRVTRQQTRVTRHIATESIVEEEHEEHILDEEEHVYDEEEEEELGDEDSE